ncbi:MAG TPA: GNAT family N-acetyltransferase, partial [candidate division Zixibacteria bacterium]|nr:GNAT family N-acetyltransferase [candidate division Zixibacteria bacterium]
AELAAIGEAWDELALGAAGRLPMLSYAWVSAHLELRQPAARPWLCLAAFAGQQLAGVLPLEERRLSVLGKTVTALRPPGDAHTRSVDAVVAPGREAEAAEAFYRALEEAVPGWFGLEMPGVEGTSPLIAAAAAGAPARARAAQIPAGLATVRETQGTWDEFFESSSGHFRKHYRQYGRKLAKLGTVEAEFLSGAQAHPEYLERFARLEAAGWKGRAGSAIGADPALTEFYRRLCARLHARRALEWHFLRVGDTYVAGHLAVRTGRTLVLWKIGYDEAYAACSPGFLLIGEMLQRAFADPATDAVNFVTDRTWLDSWRPEKHRYVDLWLYPRRLRSLVGGWWPRQARQRLRETPGVKPLLRALRGKPEPQ